MATMKWEAVVFLSATKDRLATLKVQCPRVMPDTYVPKYGHSKTIYYAIARQPLWNFFADSKAHKLLT